MLSFSFTSHLSFRYALFYYLFLPPPPFFSPRHEKKKERRKVYVCTYVEETREFPSSLSGERQEIGGEEARIQFPLPRVSTSLDGKSATRIRNEQSPFERNYNAGFAQGISLSLFLSLWLNFFPLSFLCYRYGGSTV